MSLPTETEQSVETISSYIKSDFVVFFPFGVIFTQKVGRTFIRNYKNPINLKVFHVDACKHH